MGLALSSLERRRVDLPIPGTAEAILERLRDASGGRASGRPGFIVIALRAVTKRFGGRLALDGVSIEVRAGAVHVLLGSSGSGKSTVLRLILGLVEPDGGEVLVDGTPVTESTRAGLVRRMGYVVQDGGLYPHLTAYQNVALPAEAHGWPRRRLARARRAGGDGGTRRGQPARLPTRAQRGSGNASASCAR